MGVGRGATRVAIYARVSTGEQTPELQLRELRDYAGRRKRTRSPSGNIASIWSGCGEPTGFQANAVVSSLLSSQRGN